MIDFYQGKRAEKVMWITFGMDLNRGSSG